MKLGFWKLKVTAGIGNIRTQPIRCAQSVRSTNPVWTFLPSGSPLSALRLPTHRVDQCDLAISSGVSLRFYSRVFSFYFTDGASGSHFMFSQILHLILQILIGVHGLGFWLGL
jgi:hypothetical protein